MNYCLRMERRVLFFWMGMCGLAAAAVAPDFLIQNYSVGRVSAVMTPAQAAKQYRAQRVKWWEPYRGVHVIDIDPSPNLGTPPAIRINLDRDQKYIWLISISDKRYQTSKGIAIGSAFSALRKAHPRLKIRAEEGEMDRNIIADIFDEGIACQLEYDDATWRKMLAQPNRQDISISVVPDDKLIQSISVYPPRQSSSAPSTTEE